MRASPGGPYTEYAPARTPHASAQTLLSRSVYDGASIVKQKDDGTYLDLFQYHCRQYAFPAQTEEADPKARPASLCGASIAERTYDVDRVLVIDQEQKKP